MNVTPQIQMAILGNQLDTIAKLQLLLIHHEKLSQRSATAAAAYAEFFLNETRYTSEYLRAMPDISHLTVGNNEYLKKCTIKWIVKYTVDEGSALYLAAMTKSTSQSIYKSLKEWLQDVDRQNPGKFDRLKSMFFDEALKLILRNTRYEILYPMLIEAYQFIYTEKTTKVQLNDDNITSKQEKESKKQIRKKIGWFHPINDFSIFTVEDPPAQYQPDPSMFNGEVPSAQYQPDQKQKKTKKTRQRCKQQQNTATISAHQLDAQGKGSDITKHKSSPKLKTPMMADASENSAAYKDTPDKARQIANIMQYLDKYKLQHRDREKEPESTDVVPISMPSENATTNQKVHPTNGEENELKPQEMEQRYENNTLNRELFHIPVSKKGDDSLKEDHQKSSEQNYPKNQRQAFRETCLQKV
jgi:hypothetical protein